MTLVDAAGVYSILGLNLQATFALVRILVTLVIILLTLRIPFKRNYHWMFLIVSIFIIWHSFSFFYLQLATSVAETPIRNFLLGWAHSRVQALVIFQFVVYFVSRKLRLWQKLVLIAGYIFVSAAVWIPNLIDPSFLGGPSHLTSVGWQNGPGTGDAYLRPNGLDIFTTAMGVLSFILLIRYYRSQKSDLLRGQTKYLIVGMLLIFIGFYALYIVRAFGGPNLQDLFGAAGDFVLLLGLRKKGFYSVTPTAETATITEPVKYPLEEGRSYLASDPKTAFESFSELARSGREGLLVTRTFPTDVRKDYGLQTTPIRWLAESKGQDAIPPEDLLGLSLMIKEFLDKSTKPVVMIHGLEYLTSYNGFTPILRLIQGLNEENAKRRGILILPVLPGSLENRDQVLLTSETTPMPMPAGA